MWTVEIRIDDTVSTKHYASRLEAILVFTSVNLELAVKTMNNRVEVKLYRESPLKNKNL